MAVYKVPQDVEADDKLIGPFSFRQFIYLIIVALAATLAWALGRLFLPLAIIPLPIILLFGSLALPLRKDQPMEIYMAAIVSFYLKPRRRFWDADGIDSLIEIIAPHTVEVQRTKDLSQTEAERRLSYLANIVDTQGWAVRGPVNNAPMSAVNNDVYFEAQQAEDILDDNDTTSRTFDYKLSQSDAMHHKEIIDLMHSQTVAPATTSQQVEQVSQPTPEPVLPEKVKFNPYPEEIHQSVIEPLEEQAKAAAATTSANTVSPDIINLASNTDLSIETIAREANRLHKRNDSSEEVIISLR